MAHEASLVIISQLTKHLHIPADAITSMHNFKHPSGSNISFNVTQPDPQSIKDPRIGFNPHTDHGTLTLVFHKVLGGLQVLQPPEDQERASIEKVKTSWAYVEPLAGHVTVNLGDTMVMFTNGLLRSCVHRVLAPPGDQARYTRGALGYFEYPADDTVLGVITGGDVIPVTETRAETEGFTMAQFLKWRLKPHEELLKEEFPRIVEGGNQGVFGMNQRNLISSES